MMPSDLVSQSPDMQSGEVWKTQTNRNTQGITSE